MLDYLPSAPLNIGARVKLKLVASIVAISGIHLLKSIDRATPREKAVKAESARARSAVIASAHAAVRGTG